MSVATWWMICSLKSYTMKKTITNHEKVFQRSRFTGLMLCWCRKCYDNNLKDGQLVLLILRLLWGLRRSGLILELHPIDWTSSVFRGCRDLNMSDSLWHMKEGAGLLELLPTRFSADSRPCGSLHQRCSARFQGAESSARSTLRIDCLYKYTAWTGQSSFSDIIKILFLRKNLLFHITRELAWWFRSSSQ